MAAEASKAGHPGTAAEVFEHANKGEAWAATIVSQSAFRTATLCRDIQMMLDPKRIVIGGGIGLAAGYLDSMRDFFAGVDIRLTPVLVPAKLGSRAGIIGVASLAVQGN